MALMSAKKAGELVDSIETESNQNQIAQLEVLLAKAIQGNVRTFTTSLKLSKAVTKHLEWLGYTVKAYSSYDSRDGHGDSGYTIKF